MANAALNVIASFTANVYDFFTSLLLR